MHSNGGSSEGGFPRHSSALKPVFLKSPGEYSTRSGTVLGLEFRTTLHIIGISELTVYMQLKALFSRHFLLP